MHILALEPYYGGSHAAFLNGWTSRSRHTWTIFDLPAHKWKWRMRHAAFTFADRCAELLQEGSSWDLIFCSDMLNLAEFKGLVPPVMGEIPAVIYFHENQLTYPVRHADERDFHYVMTNMLSGCAADKVWFNSAYHRDVFLEALPVFLKTMPDHQPLEAPDYIHRNSHIMPPGIEAPSQAMDSVGGPLRILWAARWEHDKNPEDFFTALRIIKSKGTDFVLDVVGEQFRESPAVFERAREEFSDRIRRWGFQETREEYLNALRETDVFVSTAVHEFFGLAAVEAAAAGAFPLMPERLAYPEIFGPDADGGSEDFFYDGTPQSLADRLISLAARLADGDLWPRGGTLESIIAGRYAWDNLAPVYDEALEEVRG